MAEATLYKGYDKAALDAQYNNRRRFPDYQGYFDQWADRSRGTREKLNARLDVAYGNTATEILDIFRADARDAPIQVFIHGGYWQSLDKSGFSYVAEGMVANGVTSAVINYALAPDHGMDEIVRQARASVAWLWRNASSLGADRDRIYATGHSAGGHLVTMLLATDWPAFSDGLPANLLKGGCAISGIFDLEPIRLTYLNDVLGMDEDTATRNSPLNLAYPIAAPLQIVLGGLESEEYHRQSSAMAELWRGLGYPTELIVPPDLDHFSIVDRLDEPGSPLVKAHLAQMGL